MNGLLLSLLGWSEESRSCHLKGKRIGKIVFAAFLGGILSCLSMILLPENTSFGYGFLINGLIGWVMVSVSFGCKSMKSQMRSVGQFILLEVLVSGIMNFVLFRMNRARFYEKQTELRFMPVAAAGLCAGLLLKKFFEEYKKEKQIGSHLYAVKLCHKGRSTEVMALLDTGNHLREPVTGKAVVVVEMMTAKKLLGEREASNIVAFSNGENPDCVPENPVKLIPFHSLGEQHGMMPGVVIDKMTIYKEQQEQICEKVPIGIMEEAFSGEGLYQVILHEAYME